MTESSSSHFPSSSLPEDRWERALLAAQTVTTSHGGARHGVEHVSAEDAALRFEVSAKMVREAKRLLDGGRVGRLQIARRRDVFADEVRRLEETVLRCDRRIAESERISATKLRTFLRGEALLARDDISDTVRTEELRKQASRRESYERHVDRIAIARAKRDAALRHIDALRS